MERSGSLSTEELQRYARHFVLPEFGMRGQQRLKDGSVLVVGAGGLGSPMLLYLAAAGVGRIGIIDDDVVDETNLQRQVLYRMQDLGHSKAETARDRLLELNPHIRVDVYRERLTVSNVMDLLEPYDVVADGTDNFPTRYLVNDACVLAGKVNVYASIFRYEGQVSVFNYPDEKGERGVNYRDLFPEPPPLDAVPNCAEGGVLGVLPGIIGAMQANEVIKVLTGVGKPLAGKLFLFDAATFTNRLLTIPRNPDLVIEHLEWYDAYCATDPGQRVKEIQPAQLQQMVEDGADFQLIDVREPEEYRLGHLHHGELIPLGQILNDPSRIARDRMVVIYCEAGSRSARAILELEREQGLTNLYNLKGGIAACRNR